MIDDINLLSGFIFTSGETFEVPLNPYLYPPSSMSFKLFPQSIICIANDQLLQFWYSLGDETLQIDLYSLVDDQL